MPISRVSLLSLCFSFLDSDAQAVDVPQRDKDPWPWWTYFNSKGRESPWGQPLGTKAGGEIESC